MKRTIKKFQDYMTAAAYAEAGEWDTARKLIPENILSNKMTWLDRVFAAVTFAEAGLQNEAVRILTPTADRGRKMHTFNPEDLGLKGVRLLYGTVSI